MADDNNITVAIIIYSLLISQAQGDTKAMLEKAFDTLKNALNLKNI